MTIKEISCKYQDYVTELYRKYHMYPEPSLEEYETCRMICEDLASYGLSPAVVFNTGVVAEICGAADNGKTVLLRAETDALRVKEESGLPFASVNEGCMHACGHDANLAMMLTASRILAENRELFSGKVRVIFEPSEENACGAQGMLAAGVMEGVGSVYATHVLSCCPANQFAITEGAILAAADYFTITVTGKAAHGSEPQNGIDAITAAAAIIQQLHSVFAREYPSSEQVVLSFCQIQGGNTDNQIPEVVKIGGTARAYNPQVRNTFEETMRRVIESVAAAYRAKGELDYRWGSPPVINDKHAVALARAAVVKNYGEESVMEFTPIMGGDDMAEYLCRAPGVYAILGVRNDAIGANWPQHSNHFKIDESVLIKGVTVAAQYALDYLEE